MARYVMGDETLSTLTKQTANSSQDLGAQVRKLARAADPIQDDFQGAGKVAFMEFKGHTDEIANGLNAALASVLQGVGGMDGAFARGVQQQADETRSLMGSANFDAARFGGAGGAA
ncbi:uncharacterized protein YukE [Friedmanniella endophytica]|uniref:Uncharacterized protein YukE n=1 Tax=Microlunatus kandeliicorticis TaxID=1759536 RepID=A0A7W3IR18_9ACTN|nr:hypothetical protein [Microlunatus kandeliicorticis]MBA8793643.1 uncharacterized protein YukE [Microlunatus kandeliicorticis]